MRALVFDFRFVSILTLIIGIHGGLSLAEESTLKLSIELQVTSLTGLSLNGFTEDGRAVYEVPEGTAHSLALDKVVSTGLIAAAPEVKDCGLRFGIPTGPCRIIAKLKTAVQIEETAAKIKSLGPLSLDFTKSKRLAKMTGLDWVETIWSRAGNQMILKASEAAVAQAVDSLIASSLVSSFPLLAVAEKDSVHTWIIVNLK